MSFEVEVGKIELLKLANEKRAKRKRFLKCFMRLLLDGAQSFFRSLTGFKMQDNIIAAPYNINFNAGKITVDNHSLAAIPLF